MLLGDLGNSVCCLRFYTYKTNKSIIAILNVDFRSIGLLALSY